jgi:phytoene dehydrogenase-like protein
MSMKKDDAIIVGCGIGGSIAGAYLAKGGLKTTIFEKTDNIGGAKYRSYKLGDITTDLCHIPVSCITLNGGFGWWVKAARELGAAIQWQALPNTQVYFKGNLITMPYCTSGRAFSDFITQMMPLPEDAQKELAKVFDAAINMPEEKLWSHEMNEMPFQTWLAQQTDNELVKRLFNVMDDVSLVGATGQTSVTCTMTIMVGFLSGWVNCTYMTNGTADQIPKSFCRVATEHDAQVLLEHTVTEVIIENGRAKGVIVKDAEGKEKIYETEYVLINACYDVLGQMLGKNMPKEVQIACQSMERAHDIDIEVHFALKERIAHPTGCQIQVLDENMTYKCNFLYPDTWNRSLAPRGQAILAQKYATVAEFESRSADEWKDYFRDVAEMIFPGFKDVIELEQAHIMRTTAGHYSFFYGPKVPIECPGISNVYFIGDYTQAPGIVTERAASSATIAAKKILGQISKMK